MTISKKQFEHHLFKPNSHFEILLRGHLWIESLINKILEVHIVDSSCLDLDRMTFRLKIDVAQAFGFINPEDGKAFRALNRLRNKLAHNVMAEPSEKEIRDLITALAGHTKAIFDATTKVPQVARQMQDEPQLSLLRYWFFSYATHLDYLCARRKYQKENEVKLIQVAAVQVASEMYGGKRIPDEEARRQFALAEPPSPEDIWDLDERVTN